MFDPNRQSDFVEEILDQNAEVTSEIYLPGHLSEDSRIYLPLSSSAIVFTVQYCCTKKFKLFFTNRPTSNEYNVHLPSSILDSLTHSFVDYTEVPSLIRNCHLPVVHDKRDNLIRSGLCSAVRHIVKAANDEQPNSKFSDLLGFRNGSLRAPAEVSGWTKLCEVDLPESLSKLLSQIEKVNGLKKKRATLELPIDVVKLEQHFHKPAKLHNDDRQKRSIIAELQQLNTNDHQCYSSDMVYQADIPCAHGVKRYQITGDVGKKLCQYKNKESIQNGGGDHKVCGEDLEALSLEIGALSLNDVNFVHLYSEGRSITVADLILFSCIYFLLKYLNFSMDSLSEHMPGVLSWVDHMVTLPRVIRASEKCGFQIGLLATTMRGTEPSDISFLLPCNIQEEDPNDMELHRTEKTKYRAIRPDVKAALAKIKANDIVPVEVEPHPCGPEVHMDWESLPLAAQPAHDLPQRRVRRKCQQLENLATVVQTIAEPGDVIVDFCSGGGHLGIITAYLLPRCHVYLIENKEESLMRAKCRVDKLKLTNVTLYQSNQDYFDGKFDIGIGLHACGVATDMVLQQCIQNRASFVICPCCYGGVQNTHLMSYPRSLLFQNSKIEYKEFKTLGHVADMTEVNTAVEEEGKYCMNLVDTDRLSLAKENGYTVRLTSLQPLSCTPKNNLLIGTRDSRI